MRSGVDYVEDSFLENCKDHRLRIKVFLITRKRVHKKVLKGLRETARKELISYIKDLSFENLVLDTINNKIQKELNIKLKKIYPLGLCEIKFIGIEDPTQYEMYEKTEKENKKMIEEKEVQNKKSEEKVKKKHSK